MAHHYERDLEALSSLVGTEVPYIGLLGSRVRCTRLLSDLSERGIALDAQTRARIRAPVGLAIGAESPQEIALSIIAEIQACSAAATQRAGEPDAHASSDLDRITDDPALRLVSSA